MKKKSFFISILTGLGALAAVQYPVPARAGDNSSSQSSLAQRAISPDPATSGAAIHSLRAKGPAGLQELLEANAELIKEHEAVQGPFSTSKPSATWDRFRAALDAVSGQRDCSASHLYWYTDLDAAKAAAKAANRPIISLRLLGKLDEEYSCANSRFFRTTLYANTEVSQYLRDHFILHWQSVRPVPRITIDFGDGRKIERTVTGNSIHYVLDSDGNVIDALPGLYGPKAFLKGLNDAEQAAVKCSTLSSDEKIAALRRYHLDRMAAINAAWANDLATVGSGPMLVAQPAFVIAPPTALVAGRVALTKGAAETPMIASLQNTDDATWSRIAALHQEDAALDSGARRLIQAKYPTASQAGRATISKIRVENPMIAMINNLQRSIAEDTVRNEYQLHSKIHEWFVTGIAPAQVERLNAKVYAELFLTPDSDPWLGLVPANTFTALDNNGLVEAGPTR